MYHPHRKPPEPWDGSGQHSVSSVTDSEAEQQRCLILFLLFSFPCSPSPSFPISFFSSFFFSPLPSFLTSSLFLLSLPLSFPFIHLSKHGVIWLPALWTPHPGPSHTSRLLSQGCPCTRRSSWCCPCIVSRLCMPGRRGAGDPPHDTHSRTEEGSGLMHGGIPVPGPSTLLDDMEVQRG